MSNGDKFSSLERREEERAESLGSEDVVSALESEYLARVGRDIEFPFPTEEDLSGFAEALSSDPQAETRTPTVEELLDAADEMEVDPAQLEQRSMELGAVLHGDVVEGRRRVRRRTEEVRFSLILNIIRL